MLALVRPAAVTLVLLTLVTGVAYPLAVTGAARLMPAQAAGSLVRDGAGRVVGSALIGQAFSRPEHLHGRPSAAGSGYDPLSSGGSNYGPLDPRLAKRVGEDATALGREAPGAALPADAVTASGSGLDPDVSPAFADLQAPRIAAARGVSVAAVRAVIARETRGRDLLVLGEPRVNVLAVNLALDARPPLRR